MSDAQLRRLVSELADNGQVTFDAGDSLRATLVRRTPAPVTIAHDAIWVVRVRGHKVPWFGEGPYEWHEFTTILYEWHEFTTSLGHGPTQTPRFRFGCVDQPVNRWTDHLTVANAHAPTEDYEEWAYITRTVLRILQRMGLHRPHGPRIGAT